MLTSRGHGSAGSAGAAAAAGAPAACPETPFDTAKNAASAMLDAEMTRRRFMVRPGCEVCSTALRDAAALPTAHCRRCLPAERRTHRRSAHDQFLDRVARTHVVREVAPGHHDI